MAQLMPAVPSPAPLPDRQESGVREASLGDYGAIAALEARCGHPRLTRDAWLGRWLENPLYVGGREWPVGWVLEDGGRVVGWCGNVPVSMSFRGRRVVAARSCGWSLETGYRRFAADLVRPFHEQRVELAIGPADPAGTAPAEGAFQRAGAGVWDSAPFFVTDYRGFAEVLLRGRGVPLVPPFRMAAAAGLWAKDKLGAESVPAPAGGVCVEIVNRFGSGFDEFEERWSLRCGGRLATVRGAADLERRFGGMRGVRRLAAVRNGSITAYAVLQRDTASGMPRNVLADYRSLSADAGITAALIREALAVSRSEGAATLECPAAGLLGLECFDRWAPYRRRRARHLSYRCADPELAAALRQPGAWAVTPFEAPWPY